MKLVRGSYNGASEMAYFDRPLEAMSREQMKGLLECILHRASPGEDNAATVLEELAIAEEADRCYRRQEGEER